MSRKRDYHDNLLLVCAIIVVVMETARFILEFLR